MQCRLTSFVGLMLALFAVLLAGGCGKSGSSGVQLSGRVTANGQPVAMAGVKLHAADGQVYSGQTDSDGKFVIAAVPPGEMQVTIAMIPTTGSSGPPGSKAGPKQPPKDPREKQKMEEAKKTGEDNRPVVDAGVKINPKYADKSKSGLTWNVTPDNLTKDFNLEN